MSWVLALEKLKASQLTPLQCCWISNIGFEMRRGEGWMCDELMHRVLKLRLNDFKQVPVVLYKKEGATALWLRTWDSFWLTHSAQKYFFHKLVAQCVCLEYSTINFFLRLRLSWTNQKLSEATIFNTITSNAMVEDLVLVVRSWWKHQRIGTTPTLSVRQKCFVHQKICLVQCAKKKLFAPKNMLGLDALHQQTPAPGLTRYKRWLRTLRFGQVWFKGLLLHCWYLASKRETLTLITLKIRIEQFVAGF